MALMVRQAWAISPGAGSKRLETPQVVMLSPIRPELTALSSTERAHWPDTSNAFAHNEALLLLHLLAYEVMHTGRGVMEMTTRTGWSLRRVRECVLKVGVRIVLHARRVTLVIAETAAAHWQSLWHELATLAWNTSKLSPGPIWPAVPGVLVTAAFAAAVPPVRKPALPAFPPKKITLIRASKHFGGQHPSRAAFIGHDHTALYRVFRNESVGP